LFDPVTLRRLFLGAMVCAGMVLARPAAADEGAPAGNGRGLTRIYGTTRPFFAALGGGFAALNTLGLEHDFASGLALGLEVAPLALVFDRDATGAVTHARTHVGYTSEFIAVGAGVGAHLQHYGASGLSLASTLRLGSLDGLHFAMENTYTMTRSFYSGRLESALEGMAGELGLPLGRRFTLLLEGGFATDLWAYATLGGETFIRGAGEPGSLKIRAGFGLAAVVDNFRCLYGNRTVCENRTAAIGPTISVGLEARY
jgi:hypothetical protein